jgi:Chaperone of endosialidase
LAFFDETTTTFGSVLTSTGNVGIGTVTPLARLHTTGTVRFAGVANCASGIQSNAAGDLSCLSSSRQFKHVAGVLAPDVALANIMALRPQVGSYKATPDVPEHWLIAEEVAAVDPALVGTRDGQPYTVKTHGIVADLVAVIQQQQRRIEALERAIAR